MNNPAIRIKPKITQGNTVNLQDIKKAKDAFNKANYKVQERFLEFMAMPEEDQKELLKAFQESSKPSKKSTYIPPTLPAKGDGSYETLPAYVRITKDELIAFVKKNWGQYLAAFNPNLDTDIISRKQLRDYDKRLMTRLEKDFSPDELNDIIQTGSAKIGRNLHKSPPTKEEIQRATQILHYANRNMIEPSII